MYKDTISTENRIITAESLNEIFTLMGEKLKEYIKISEREEKENYMLDSLYQTYTFKDEGSKMKVVVDFYDNTSITFDNYENFLGIFHSRLDEIKAIDVHYRLLYTVITPKPNRHRDYYSQSIDLYINEKKMDIRLNLNSNDPKLDDVYNLLKEKILNAPRKYDFTIRKKRKIEAVVTFGFGLIPGLIISTLLLFVPTVNQLFFKGYIVYPISVVFIAYLIGGVVSSSKLDKYYDYLIPNKKYVGYDTSKHKRMYEDDIDSFVGESEILIGKKINNIKYRKIIRREYRKYKKIILKEILVLIVISLIVLVMGIFM